MPLINKYRCRTNCKIDIKFEQYVFGLGGVQNLETDKRIALYICVCVYEIMNPYFF